MKKIIPYLFIIFCLIIVSCGSSGGGGGGEPPIISNLTLCIYDAGVEVEKTNFSVGDLVDVKLDLYDKDADILTFDCVVKNIATQSTLHRFRPKKHIHAKGVKEFTSIFGLDDIASTIGTYELTIFFIDEARNKSNTLSIEYSVN